jgi:hypothetical protein
MRDFATQPAIGSPEWRAAFDRFHDVLIRLRAYEPTLMQHQPAPVTYADLVRQSGVLFEEAAFLLDTINLRNRWLLEQIRNQDRELQALVSREAELTRRAAALPGEKTAATAEYARARRDADKQRMAALSVQRAARAMRDRAQRAAKDCVYWLAIAEPPGVTPIREGLLGTRIVARQDPLVWSQQRPEGAVLITPSAPSQEEFSGVPVRRAIPAGLATDRVAAAESLIPQLADAIQVLQRNEATFARNATVAGPARSRIAVLLSTVMRSQGELNSLRAATLSLRTTNWNELQMNQVRALGNLRRAAAETYVLETYRDRVVIPEVQRFLNANRVTRTLDHASLVRIYEAHTTLLPPRSGGSYAELTRFIQMQNRTAQVLADYRIYAGAAAGLIAMDGAVQARSIQAEIQRNLGRPRGDLLRGAERETGPLAKIARALLVQ